MTTAGESLLIWYRRHHRSLPWRRLHDPYEILVSEIMLQQTRVETVLRYYEPFLERFPSVEALAAADVDTVLARWSGLGYYRRARNLHAAARQIGALGRFPSTAAALVKLPGVGVYTAAAVASIAFGEAVPVIDGNVERVLGRVLGLRVDPRRREGRESIRERASLLLNESAPGDSNQAMMELGAVLCTPTRPDCPSCPLARGCHALASGHPESFPLKRPARRVIRVHRVVAVASEEDRYLLVRIPEDSDLLAGLWEFPWVEGGRTLAAKSTLLAERYGGAWELGRRLGRARHAVTFRSITLEIREARLSIMSPTSVAEGAEAGWFSCAAARQLPSTSMLTKVLSELGAPSAAPTAN